MPQVFYVDPGGTLGVNDDTPYSSFQSGTCPTGSNAYPTIEEAIEAGTKTTPYTFGDFCLISTSHNESHSASQTTSRTNTTDESAAVSFIFTVDAANCENYKKATSDIITTTTSNDAYTFSFPGWKMVCAGLQTNLTDTLNFGGNHSKWTTFDLTVKVAGSNEIAIQFAGDHSHHRCYNPHITFNGTNNNSVGCFSFNGNKPLVEIYKGTIVDNSSSSQKEHLLDDTNGKILIDGLDISQWPDSAVYLFEDTMFDAANDARSDIVVRNLKLPANVLGIVENASPSMQGDVLVEGCSATAGPEKYQYFRLMLGCRIQSDTSVYRNESLIVQGTSQKISLKFDTAAYVTPSMRLSFEVPSQYIKLSQTASDVIELYITSDTALTDRDVWAHVLYPDETNTHETNVVVSSGDLHGDSMFFLDPFGTGTALTTDSGSTWTGGKTYKYKISIDTSGDRGSDCVPRIFLNVGIASVIFYLDPVPTVAAT